jgi:hypothetical protein
MYIKSLYNTSVLINLKYMSNEEVLKKNILKSLIKHYGNKCNNHGFLSSNNIILLEYTIGTIHSSNISFNVLYEGIVMLPVIGTILTTKVISNEGLFYLADFENIGKIFIITKSLLDINETVSVIVLNYYFNNGDKNIYLYAKYIENQNYLIPEIPTKEECDKYLNTYLKENVEFDIINSSLSNMTPNISFETSLEEDEFNNSTIDKFEDEFEHTSIGNLDNTSIGNLDNTSIGNLDNTSIRNLDNTSIRNLDNTSIGNLDNTSIEANSKMEGGLNDTITSEYIDNISKINLKSDEEYIVKDIEGGLRNVGYNCYLNCILFMLRYNDTFIKKNKIDSIKKYLKTKERIYETPLIMDELKEMIDMDLYKQQKPEIFLDRLMNNDMGRVFYNFERVDENLVPEEFTNVIFDYKQIDNYVKELKSINTILGNIRTITKSCINCNYEVIEVKLSNMVELNYNEQTTLQKVIDDNESIITDIKCNICKEYFYREDNDYNITKKDVLLLFKTKVGMNFSINRTIKLNKKKWKVVSYILKTPNDSDNAHYRTLIKEGKLLYDDDKIYGIKNIGEFMKDIYMIHIKLI